MLKAVSMPLLSSACYYMPQQRHAAPRDSRLGHQRPLPLYSYPPLAHGARIGDIYCGASMHVDDLALVSDSEAGLQYMLDIVTRYAVEWRYELNALK